MKAVENELGAPLRAVLLWRQEDPNRILRSGLSLYGVQPSLPRRKRFKDADNSFKPRESCSKWDYSSQASEGTVSSQ